jgi:hypothetical protein
MKLNNFPDLIYSHHEGIKLINWNLSKIKNHRLKENINYVLKYIKLLKYILLTKVIDSFDLYNMSVK